MGRNHRHAAGVGPGLRWKVYLHRGTSHQREHHPPSVGNTQPDSQSRSPLSPARYPKARSRREPAPYDSGRGSAAGSAIQALPLQGTQAASAGSSTNPEIVGKTTHTERPGGQTWPDPFFSSLNWWVGGMMGMFCLTKSIAWIIVFFLGSWCWRCFLEELHGMNWVTVALLVYRCMCVWLFICFFVWLFVCLVGWFIFWDVVPCTFCFPQKDTCLQWCLFGPHQQHPNPSTLQSRHCL